VDVFPRTLKRCTKSAEEKIISPRFLCDDLILYKVGEIQVCVIVPVRHHRVVWVHVQWLKQHDLIKVAVKDFKTRQWLSEIHWVFHHQRIIHPSS